MGDKEEKGRETERVPLKAPSSGLSTLLAANRLAPLSHLSAKCLHGAACVYVGWAGCKLLISTHFNGSGSGGY